MFSTKARNASLRLVEAAVMIEMLGIDIGDDDDIGGQLDEGAVRFIRLDHHPVALAEPRIGAIGIDDAAIDDGRIEAAGIEQRRDERCRRRLAMRAADRDAGFEAHQFGQHFGAAHDRQDSGARASTSSGLSSLTAEETTTTCASPRFSARVADDDLDAALAQPRDIVVVGDVGALHADSRASP